MLKSVVWWSLVAGCTAFMSTPVSLGKLRTQRAAVSPVSGFAPVAGLQLRSGRLTPAANRKTSVSQLQMYDKIKAEYVWIGGRGGVGDDYRCKTRILDSAPKSVEDLPLWNYDGSSTGQAPGSDSEVFLKPVYMCPDPMRGGPHILVLCEMLKPDMTPIPTNTRTAANDIFNKGLDEVPWYGIEQEYTLFKEGAPLGWCGLPHSRRSEAGNREA